LTWTQVRFPGRPNEVVVAAEASSATNVWAFTADGGQSRALRWNGRTWSRVASGHGLQGGSALSACSIWAFDGSAIAHWNGSTWSRTPVAHLLPPKQELNGPMLTGIYAQSKDSVSAIAHGGRPDEGGPTVVLHWDGHHWYKVAEGNFGSAPSRCSRSAPTATAASGFRCLASTASGRTWCTTHPGTR